MKCLLIIPKNKEDLEFLKTLVTRLGYSIREFSIEEMEDLGLLRAMISEKKTDYVTEKKIRKALGKK